MVLFLFVIMLLGVDRNLPMIERLPFQRPAAIVLAAAVALEVFFAVRAGIGFSAKAPATFDAVNAAATRRRSRGAVPQLLLPVRGHLRAAHRRGVIGPMAARKAPAVASPSARSKRREDADRLLPGAVSAMLFAIGTVGVLVRRKRAAHLHVGRAAAERREPRARRVLPDARDS